MPLPEWGDSIAFSASYSDVDSGRVDLKVPYVIKGVEGNFDFDLTSIAALLCCGTIGLVVVPGSFIVTHRAPIISAAARNNVPAVYFNSDFVRNGGLLSYGPDLVDIYRRAATYVDRILRGEKPGDLPVQFPTKFEMTVNLKTAKQIGLTIPPNVLARADKVIK